MKSSNKYHININQHLHYLIKVITGFWSIFKKESIIHQDSIPFRVMSLLNYQSIVFYHCNGDWGQSNTHIPEKDNYLSLLFKKKKV